MSSPVSSVPMSALTAPQDCSSAKSLKSVSSQLPSPPASLSSSPPSLSSLSSTSTSTSSSLKFDRLVQDIKKVLGPSSGLTSDDVDVDHLIELMEQYDAADGGWQRYNFGDASRGYTRNLVDEGNGKANLLVLVWSPGKGSAIHDHGNAHCLMKILQGQLTETRYAFPERETNTETEMQVTSEKTYCENAVAYMADELGVHKMWNRGSDFAVSLHLYTPPNVAKEGCNIFHEKTSKCSHVSSVGYYTEYGRRPE